MLNIESTGNLCCIAVACIPFVICKNKHLETYRREIEVYVRALERLRHSDFRLEMCSTSRGRILSMGCYVEVGVVDLVIFGPSLFLIVKFSCLFRSILLLAPRRSKNPR